MSNKQLEDQIWDPIHLSGPIQLQEYQTDMGRCRFDTLGKSNPAHRAGPPTGRGRWVAPARWVSASATAAGPPTTQGHFHGGQGSISLEYQTCTSPHPFDTLVTGMPGSHLLGPWYKSVALHPFLSKDIHSRAPLPFLPSGGFNPVWGRRAVISWSKELTPAGRRRGNQSARDLASPACRLPAQLLTPVA